MFDSVALWEFCLSRETFFLNRKVRVNANLILLVEDAYLSTIPALPTFMREVGSDIAHPSKLS